MLEPVPDNFPERLRQWRVGQRLTQSEASALLEIDRSYMSQLERGRPPGNSLRTRFGQVEKQTLGRRHINVAGGIYSLKMIPVLSWAQAGQATAFEQIPNDWDETVPTDVSDEHAFAVRLRGDSMEPRFSDGDVAVLLPSIAATNGEIVVANLKDEGVLCKIMHVQLDKQLITLSSYNPAYPASTFHRDQFHWIYPVASVMKQLRRK